MGERLGFEATSVQTSALTLDETASVDASNLPHGRSCCPHSIRPSDCTIGLTRCRKGRSFFARSWERTAQAQPPCEPRSPARLAGGGSRSIRIRRGDCSRRHRRSRGPRRYGMTRSAWRGCWPAPHSHRSGGYRAAAASSAGPRGEAPVFTAHECVGGRTSRAVAVGYETGPTDFGLSRSLDATGSTARWR